MTKSNYPLVAVEIIIWEDGLRVYTYDIGFEPPFYDICVDPAPFSPVRPPYTKEKGIKILEEKGIFAENWVYVDNLLAYECNALIRSDIRSDIRKIFGYEDELPKPISRAVGLSAVNTLSRFSGQPANIQIKFLEKCTKEIEDGINMLMMFPKTEEIDELRAFTGNGLLQFHMLSENNRAGFVLDNQFYNIALVTIIETEYMCMLFDFSSKYCLSKGVITELIINLPKYNRTYILNSSGLA
ncbi:MAG: hypothetical protein Q8M98_05430 [Candidatus Cloacimonadaceae bacterium]|nr:hypothetical protein [Candidatus Cloacimonadaceae bacterium]